MQSGEELPFFVYGTLMTSFENHENVVGSRLRDATRATLSEENQWLFHFHGFPGLFFRCPPGCESVPPCKAVVGQLLTIKKGEYSAVLADMDHLEGYNEAEPGSSHYVRVVKMAQLPDGTRVPAYVYEANQLDVQKEKAEYVSSGDWRQYMKDTGNVPLGQDWAASTNK